MQIPHNDMRQGVTGAILAGGSSHRMGLDKATLRIGRTTLFAKVEQVMRQLCDQVLIAGDRPDLAHRALPCFPDTYSGSSLAGLHTALSHARTDWIAVLPCDLPFPSLTLMQHLLDARRDVQAVIPRHPMGIEPLVACYHKSCLPQIETRLGNGQHRMTALLAELNVRFLEPEQFPTGWRRALINLNRPEDLARLTQSPPAVTVIARSGTGKTTLLEKLIRELTARGWTIGALKHDAHRFEIDHEGKDTWRMTRAGAAVTAISSAEKSATLRWHDGEPSVEEIIARDFPDVDLVLTEGFKASALPKVEVHRQALGQPLLSRGDRHDSTLVAVASDAPLSLDVPVFDLNDPTALADFLERSYLA